MQDTAPRLIPSLIEMLNTGYDEICEVINIIYTVYVGFKAAA